MSDPYSVCPWATLGIPRGSSEETVRTAYRRLALRYHPDRNHGCAESALRFTRITAAMEAIRTGANSSSSLFTEDASSAVSSMGTLYARRHRTPRYSAGYSAFASTPTSASRAASRASSASASVPFALTIFAAAALFVAGLVGISDEKRQLQDAQSSKLTNVERERRPRHGKGRRAARESAEAKTYDAVAQ